MIGNYSGHLSNFSETLVLSDTTGTVVAQTSTPNQPSDPQSFLVISELMYHPADGAGEEFVELMNISDTVTLDLTGVKFTDGIDFEFAAGTMLAPGARIVVGAADFLNGTALSNGGERLKLEDADNSTIKQFSYNDRAPWPTSPDGGGPSLVLIRPETNPDPGDGTNWRPSSANGGNPGGTDAIPFPGGDLFEYALAGQPGVVATTGGDHEFTFSVRLGSDQVAIEAEWSPDLVTWTPSSDSLLPVLESLPDGSGNLQIRLAMPHGVRGFARLRATLLP